MANFSLIVQFIEPFNALLRVKSTEYDAIPAVNLLINLYYLKPS